MCAFLEEPDMRNFLIAAAAFAGVVLSAQAPAQDPAAGAAVGAAAGTGTGGAVAEPPGAAVGAAVGGTVGAASQAGPQHHQDRVIIEDRAPAVTHKTCVEEPGRRDCVETRR
jgi:hypothetical protein